MQSPEINQMSEEESRANKDLKILSMNKAIQGKVKTILNKNNCRDLFSDVKLNGEKIYKNIGYRRRIQFKFLQK